MSMGRTLVSGSFDQSQTMGHFFAPYEIDWPEGTRSKRAGGVDEVQALLLAMQRAHTDLLSARENHGHTVSWLNERSLGFPVPDTIRDWDPDATL